MKSALQTRVWVLVLAAVLTSCASGPSKQPSYIVKRGDTLYSIARRHGVDHRDLARWNGIGRDNLIHPGQILRLTPPLGSRATAASPAKTASTATRTPVPKPPAARPVGPPIPWQWPVDGGQAVLTARPNGGHGLTISGRLGQEIRAASAGRVVYTGTGLLGYGQLLIIKHNDTYLSAYGHTQTVLVKEQQEVKRGQAVATMGAGPQGTPMLYFEIRVNGSPENPLALLPQR